MSFESTNKKKDNLKARPLIEYSSQEQFNQLQMKFLEFIKLYDEINDFDSRLNNLNRKEYEKIKDDVHFKIHKMPDLLNDINNIISQLNSANFKEEGLKMRITEQIKIINEKLQPRQIELPNLLNKIVDKEGKLAKRLSLGDPDELSMALGSFNSVANERRLDTDGTGSKGSFRDSKIAVRELIDNNEYLKKRQEELEDIKKISSQVKDLTVYMQREVLDQGEQLKSLESNVVESNLNVKKAELEIADAEKTTRKSRNKICLLTFLVGTFVLSLIAILIILIVNSNSTTTTNSSTSSTNSTST